jgi:hypothetical protein
MIEKPSAQLAVEEEIKNPELVARCGDSNPRITPIGMQCVNAE